MALMNKVVFWYASDQGSLVGLRTQDYMSLCAAVTICTTHMCHIQRNTDTDSILISL